MSLPPEAEFKAPISASEVLRVGREFKKLRDTVGFQMFRDMMMKRIEGLALAAIDSKDPDKPQTYWKGRIDEIRELIVIVDVLILDATEAAERMRDDDRFRDVPFHLPIGTSQLS